MNENWGDSPGEATHEDVMRLYKQNRTRMFTNACCDRRICYKYGFVSFYRTQSPMVKTAAMKITIDGRYGRPGKYQSGRYVRHPSMYRQACVLLFLLYSFQSVC